uniref:40S ribosomal protein S31 n=1 Tax=Saccharomyces cerevisiae TaxID=4932 RepID=UPI0020155643|nr:Chain Bf, 40S ribosomal protein S31 [Saccharomyces cerevisiae]7MPJ_Bf Chain Bf, 40S ribosomal protein S31 [Saccharomyces cerevisiae]7N8B_Bf Chain Bf, 40S ribosomal protein S31 [Saccharomyces cerevisiae]
HKHKAVKLAVLSYYKVDAEGKVTKLRRECSNPTGVFLANHKDRLYCGKCHSVYKVNA